MKYTVLVLAFLLSGCGSLFPWSAADLATTGYALNGGRFKEVGAARVCGSDPAVVVACAMALKAGGYHALKSQVGPAEAKRTIEFAGAVGAINNLAALAGVASPMSLIIGIGGAAAIQDYQDKQKLTGD